MIYTLYFKEVGTWLILFFNSRISSTPLLDAASISIISGHSFSLDARQASHSSQGLPLTGCKQFTVLANIFAIVVLPVPLGPDNKYA